MCLISDHEGNTSDTMMTKKGRHNIGQAVNVKHVYFASIIFSRFEENCEIKYTRIFGISHQYDFVCIEYQLFRHMILVLYNVNNIRDEIQL